jgi:hypothetical protein
MSLTEGTTFGGSIKRGKEIIPPITMKHGFISKKMRRVGIGSNGGEKTIMGAWWTPLNYIRTYYLPR